MGVRLLWRCDPGEEGFFGFEGLGLTAKEGGAALEIARGEELKWIVCGVG